jgi:putative NADH-flavin reductase
MAASSLRVYAVLCATGNCGTALIKNLQQRSNARIHAHCRNRVKLLQQFPEIKDGGTVAVFEGGIYNIDLIKSCIRGCHAVFLVVSTNDNIPGCRLAQDMAAAVIQALQELRETQKTQKTPKLVLLSSGTIDSHFSQHVPWLLQRILLRSASHVYRDLKVTEKLLRAYKHWLRTVYVMPGALAIDVQRGHALSFTEQDSPISYLDLAAAMIETADDEDGRYDERNVSVINTGGKPNFPKGTPWCIFIGLLRHYFPLLHPYLPMNTGPK